MNIYTPEYVHTGIVFQNSSLELVTTHKQNLLYLRYYLLHLSPSPA